MKYGIDTLDKKSFLSFYSTYSSPKRIEAVLIQLYQPYYEVRDLGCSNKSVTKVARIGRASYDDYESIGPAYYAGWALTRLQKVFRESLFGDSAVGLCLDKLAHD